MRQKELLDNIKKYLARFQAQVQISSSNREYDINSHSENVVIPLINLLFKANFKNANYSEKKNIEAIDLLDDSKKIAFQITSTNSIDKVKNTLTKLLSSKLITKIDVLYIYVLTNKQKSYSQIAIDKICKKKFKFDVEKHIIDANFIYSKIVELNDLRIIENIENLLKQQFSDVYITKSFTLTDYNNFIKKYTESCISNFSRINFFGLSLTQNRPREIELYKLFVSPRFSSRNRLSNYKKISSLDLSISELLDNNEAEHTNQFSFNHDLQSIKLNIGNTKLLEYLITKSNIIRNNERIAFENFQYLYAAKQKIDEIDFSEIFTSNNHIVIIGKPGAGKSSLIKFAICKILEKDKSTFNLNEIYEYLPFRIELHKFNKFKKNNRGSILDYTSDLIKAEYQISISLEEITSIVNAFPTLFFFDGLDEIFDIQERINVRNDIENFIHNYTKVKSVVTSRYESYEEVKLTGKIFAEYDLLDFNDSQIETYVNKWYAIEEINTSLRLKESKNCLKQLGSVEPELKQNPLLLSLILLLYRNELDIPTSKLRIYESCTNTIVETRDDKEKKLDIKLKVSHKISIFASLGFWIFENDLNGNSLPNYENVKSFIQKNLLDKGEFTDEHLANLATKEFLDFARLRSIFVENKFTHKTFLEYFTAYYIYSYYYSSFKRLDELLNLLSSYIGLSAWSVVLELLVCKIDSTQINYEVIDYIFDKLYSKSKTETLIFFLQISKYLSFISPKKLKFLIEESIIFCLEKNQTNKENTELLFNLLSNLAPIERFRNTITEAFINYLDKENKSLFYANAFAYELAIVSGVKSLAEVLHLKKLELKNEYIFILKHYSDLFEESKYFESLKLFISNFSISSITKRHKSPFNQKIFFNSSYFNWFLTYLADKINSENIYSIYQKFIEQEITTDILIECAKIKSENISEIILKEKTDFVLEKDKGYKFFVKTLRETYITKANIQSTTNSKFYDKFFKTRKRH